MAQAALTTPAGRDAADYEFAFGDADFDRVRRLIHARAGISLHAGKRAMVYSRLARRLRTLGERSFADYLGRLEQAGGAAGEQEWQAFVNCLTTNLTSFFREAHHFPILAQELQRRRGQAVRIWCNAASTGEEPYSIAMTALEALGPDPAVSILCSDIDTDVLRTAAEGIYPADAGGLATERLHRHFLQGTRGNAGLIRVKPALRRLVSFRPHNLMDERWSLGEPFDLVFCRNVMIYFDAPTQRRVLERIHAVTKPRGLLFAGHSENFTTSRDLFRLRGKTVYERL